MKAHKYSRGPGVYKTMRAVKKPLAADSKGVNFFSPPLASVLRGCPLLSSLPFFRKRAWTRERVEKNRPDGAEEEREKRQRICLLCMRACVCVRAKRARRRSRGGLKGFREIPAHYTNFPLRENFRRWLSRFGERVNLWWIFFVVFFVGFPLCHPEKLVSAPRKRGEERRFFGLLRYCM